VGIGRPPRGQGPRDIVIGRHTRDESQIRTKEQNPPARVRDGYKEDEKGRKDQSREKDKERVRVV
jgi:hypothetical protein